MVPGCLRISVCHTNLTERTWRRSTVSSGLKFFSPQKEVTGAKEIKPAAYHSEDFDSKKEFRELPINWKHCFFAVNCQNSGFGQEGHSEATHPMLFKWFERFKSN